MVWLSLTKWRANASLGLATIARTSRPAGWPPSKRRAMFCPPPPFMIFGGDLQVVQVVLQPGATCLGDPASFCYSSADVQVQSPPQQGILGLVSRLLTGDTFCLHTYYVNKGTGPGYIAFSAPHAGKIIPVDLRVKGPLMCQMDSFVCGMGDVRTNTKFLSVEAGFLGGDGILLQRITGQGTAFLHGGGTVMEKMVSPNEVIIVNIQCLAAFSENCRYQIVDTARTAFFPNRALQNVKLTGPGVVYLQSLPLSRLSNRVVTSATNAMPGRDIMAAHNTRCFRFITLLTILLFSLIALHALIITLEEQDL